MIGGIRLAYPPAKWSYFAQDLTLLDQAIRGEAPAPEAPAPDQTEVDAQKMMDELMASQAAMMASLTAPIPDADPSRFATVVEEEDAPADGQPAAAVAGNGSAGNGAAENGANSAALVSETAAPAKKKQA
jgi:hypothetical protein